MGKLKIDLKLGIIEIEGDDAFVKDLYLDVKDYLKTDPSGVVSQAEAGRSEGSEEQKREHAQPAQRRAKSNGATRESYEINKELDLYGRSGKLPLQSFYDSKSPSSNLERNAVFVYYLKKMLEKPLVNLSDIYTCYKAVNVPVAGALKQSIADTSGSRYGWIDASNFDDIKIPIRGETFVEHNLPKAKPAKGTTAKAATESIA
jgi:hypothetical protein